MQPIPIPSAGDILNELRMWAAIPNVSFRLKIENGFLEASFEAIVDGKNIGQKLIVSGDALNNCPLQYSLRKMLDDFSENFNRKQINKKP